MKKVPKRMCVVCRNMFDKTELVRIVKSADGDYEIDLTGKKNGRGCYICKDCAEKCASKKLLNKILKANIDEKTYSGIEEYGKRKD